MVDPDRTADQAAGKGRHIGFSHVGAISAIGTPSMPGPCDLNHLLSVHIRATTAHSGGVESHITRRRVRVAAHRLPTHQSRWKEHGLAVSRLCGWQCHLDAADPIQHVSMSWWAIRSAVCSCGSTPAPTRTTTVSALNNNPCSPAWLRRAAPLWAACWHVGSDTVCIDGGIKRHRPTGRRGKYSKRTRQTRDGLGRADTVMAWDPVNRSLIVANIVGTMPWTVAGGS